MPAEQKGSIYKTKRRGYGVRWLEDALPANHRKLTTLSR